MEEESKEKGQLAGEGDTVRRMEEGMEQREIQKRLQEEAGQRNSNRGKKGQGSGQMEKKEGEIDKT